MRNYLELLRSNSALKLSSESREVDLLILSNITVNTIKEYIDYSLKSNSFKGNISFGDYDNILQNSLDYNLTDKVILVFWELANVVQGLDYKIDSLTTVQLNDLEQKIRHEIRIIFAEFAKAPLVIMNIFSGLAFNYLRTEEGALESLADRLNKFCEEVAPKSVRFLNIDKCLVKNGIEESIDIKGFLQKKSLYKHAFYWNYVQMIQPYINAINGDIKKVLALDCDNTLWKGILGEDGNDGIRMASSNGIGQVYASAQNRALGLSKKGVLLALVSKNNLDEVDSVLESHPDMILREEHLVSKKVNWNPKDSNINELAGELNVGLDSIVFVDDSNFEIKLVNEHLPSVKTIRVPEDPWGYYVNQQLWANLFVQVNSSLEDGTKLRQYKDNKARQDEAIKHLNLKSFLESLELEMQLAINVTAEISRMAQMTQKTNQFNLTTKRLSEAEISNRILSRTHDFITISVKDKFGDNGITGLCVIDYRCDEHACIEIMLMSCRIIGRTLEYKFIEKVVEHVLIRANKITASYVPTAKNTQVSDFYEKCGFQLVSNEGNEKLYTITKDSFRINKHYNYIKVHDVKN